MWRTLILISANASGNFTTPQNPLVFGLDKPNTWNLTRKLTESTAGNSSLKIRSLEDRFVWKRRVPGNARDWPNKILKTLKMGGCWAPAIFCLPSSAFHDLSIICDLLWLIFCLSSIVYLLYSLYLLPSTFHLLSPVFYLLSSIFYHLFYIFYLLSSILRSFISMFHILSSLFNLLSSSICYLLSCMLVFHLVSPISSHLRSIILYLACLSYILYLLSSIF